MHYIWILCALATVAGRSSYGLSSYVVWFCTFPPAAFYLIFSFLNLTYDKDLNTKPVGVIFGFNALIYLVLFHGHHDFGLFSDFIFNSLCTVWLLGSTFITYTVTRLEVEGLR